MQTTGDARSFLYKTYALPNPSRIVVAFDMQPLPCDSNPYTDFVTLAVLRFGSGGVESQRAELSLNGFYKTYGAYAGPPLAGTTCQRAGACKAIGRSPGTWEHVKFVVTSAAVDIDVANGSQNFPWNADGATQMQIALGLWPTNSFHECEIKFDNVTVDF